MSNIYQIVEESPLIAFRWKAIQGWPVDYVSKNITQFGYTKDQLLSGQIQYREMIHPDDRERVELELSNYIANKVDAFTQEYRILTADSKVVWIDDRTSIDRNENGGINYIHGTVLDVSAHKKILKNEQELREILDSMIDAVLSIDQNGIITTFNNAAEQLFGYSKDEILGEKINCLMPEPHTNNHDDYLNRYVETGKKHIIGKTVEIEAIHKNKSILPIHLSVVELPHDATGSKRFIGTCQDIHVVKEQEELLRRSQKMDALGKITGGIAHDYNNMLGVVLGYAEILENKLHDQPHLAKYANQIYKAGEKGTKLTKRLLSFSRQDSPTQANINTLLQEQQDMLQKTLTVRIQLLLELSDTLWDVSIDQSEFEDAILNMSINAMHAMTDGGDLTISTCNLCLLPLDAAMLELPTGDYVQLTIADTGCGIDDVTKSKLFDPFFSTKGNRGTGLGLSQVFGFIKRANGVIKVNSQLGQGSQFILYFPRTDKDDKGSVSELEDTTKEITGKESILIVDDEAILLNLLSSIVKSHGYTVFRAGSAKLALELLKKEHVDLMISDVIMPKMNGYQLASIVQKKYPHIKIQLASGYSDERQKSKFDRYLYNNLLFKPYDTSALLKRIRLLLDDEYKKEQ
ncbi:MAG: PAS domain S-box protein [Gammaproteobacteria bacterium]|nr:PAS domain S-box protein [Gammaproteobacteria bacterium]